MGYTGDMKYRMLFLMALWVHSASSLHAQPPSWSSRGVGGGGALFSPSFSPYRPLELFVACDMSELFHTTNAGAPWTLIPFQQIEGNRSTHVQFTSDPNTLYAIDNTSISGGDTHRPSRSTDGGSTWTPLANDPTTLETYFLFADPASTQRFFVTDYSTLFFTTNGGISFNAVFTNNSGSGCYVAGAYFDQPTIFIGTTTGLLISTNGGASFAISAVGGIPPTEEMATLSGAKENGTTRLFCSTVAQGTLYSGILFEDVYGGATRKLYTLDIGQTNWVTHTNGIRSTHYVPFIDSCRTNISIAYAFGEDTSEYPVAYRTTNGAASWQQVLFPYTNVNIRTGWEGWGGDRGWTYGASYVGFAVSPINPAIAAFTDYGFVHMTTNSGTDWFAAYVDKADLNTNAIATPTGKSYHSVELEDTTCWWLTWSDRTNIFASFSDIQGIRSTNAGVAWSFDYSGQSYNSTYQSVRHTNGTLYVAVSSVHDMYQSTRLQDAQLDPGTGEIKFSTDKGKTWQSLHNFTNVTYSLALDPNNTNRLLAGVVDSTNGGIYLCTNLAAGAASSWSRLTTPPRTEGHPHSIHILHDGTFVCTFDGRRNPAGTFTNSSGVFVSTNNGASWMDRSHTNMIYWTKDVVIDPWTPGESNWYVCVWSGWGGAPNNKGGLYRSADRGLIWTRISSSDRLSSCTFSPANSNELYFTTEQEGLWHTDNIRATSPVFDQVADYPFKQPERVFFNPYDATEIWVTSFGNGLRVGSDVTSRPHIGELSWANSGIVLGWSSTNGSVYSVQKRTNLASGAFTPVATNLPATPPMNVYTDSLTAPAAFYRVTEE